MIPLLLLLVLPVFSAARLATLLFGEAEPWRRRFAAICLIVPVVYFPIIILSTPALLTPWPVIIFHALLLAVLFIFKPATTTRFAESLQAPLPPTPNPQPLIPKSQPPTPSPTPHISPVAAWLICIPLVLVTVKHVAKLFTRGSLFFSDDFAYHGFAVSGWFQNNSLEHPLITLAHYYPYNPHILSFHASLTSPDHQWVWIASLYWIFLAVAAFLALGRHLKGPATITFAAAASLFAASSTVAWVTEKHSATDLAGAAALLAAFALAVPRPGAARREKLATVILSGMLCGFAVGSKVTNAVPAGVLFWATLFMQAGATQPRNWPDAIRGAILFALGAFSTAFYWYLRNWTLSGNPLFPVRIWKFKGPLRTENLENSVMLTYIKETPFDLGMWNFIFWRLISWPHHLGFLAFLGLLGGVILLAFALRRTIASRNIAPLSSPMPWLIVAGIAMLLIHFKAPFSGTTLGGSSLDPYSRYIMFVFGVGLAGGAWLLSGFTRWRASQIALSVITLLIVIRSWGWYRETIGELPALILSIILVVGLLSPLLPWASSLQSRRRPSCFLLLVPPAIVFGLLLAILTRPLYVPGPHPMIEPHEHVVRFEPTRDAIDALPPGSRIAKLSSRLWEHWPLYGKQSQHYPILLHENGYALPDLHTAYEMNYTGGSHFHPRSGVTRPDQFERPDLLGMNLRTARLDYMVFSQHSFGEPRWPLQRPRFLELDGWQLIWTDGFSEIYAPEGKHPPGYILNAPHNLMADPQWSRTKMDETPTSTDATPLLDDEPSATP